jgi:hypothetical protein
MFKFKVGDVVEVIDHEGSDRLDTKKHCGFKGVVLRLTSVAGYDLIINCYYVRMIDTYERWFNEDMLKLL